VVKAATNAVAKRKPKNSLFCHRCTGIAEVDFLGYPLTTTSVKVETR